MKTIAELEAIRKRTLDEISMRTDEESVRIVIGMATCGIAAGARTVMTAFLDEIQKRNIHNVHVSATGCIGVCRLEPIVDVIDKDGNKTTYVHMTPEKAAKVVVEHIANGKICVEYTLPENK
ncbi:ferredoxin [Acetobacterium sp.]|jgi:NADP-reducing hydrogenase subunit HndB|uniref:(2Fe-2S) ferredoxin domain-containing protein n=1 Tax=Acetobacterium sp. TaxID=1872094 RepID=UPI000CBDA97D|nr:(2Fe-2S) ferredoxin domain-containing protein [Acetobacterium sp.]MDO9491247.1 (2Fe-2S) ferredoxin domain-containing protein [Acetobacterium sp.]PKM71146.1 MAG: ferredoxin [Firmicutes bacterium HGW-Firmicutes-17]